MKIPSANSVLLCLKVFVAHANLVASVLARNAHDSGPGFALVCHSEELSDEESAFSSRSRELGRAQSRCFTFVQHDTKANSDPKDFFPADLSIATRYLKFLSDQNAGVFPLGPFVALRRPLGGIDEMRFDRGID